MLRVGPSGEPGHLLSQRQHLLAGLQVALGVAAVDVVRSQRHEPAGGVQHVEGGAEVLAGHAHLVGEHADEAVVVGEGKHPSGVHCRPHSCAGELVVGHSQHQLVGLHDLEPAPEHLLGDVGPAGSQREAQLGIGAKHHQQVAAVGADETRGADGLPTLAGSVDGCGQPAQRGPAGTRGRERHHPRQARVTQLTALGRRDRPRRTGTGCDRRCDGEVDPDDRGDAGGRAGLGEADGTVEAAPIGDREGVHLMPRRRGDKGRRS